MQKSFMHYQLIHFPDEHAALEKETKSPCTLNSVSQENFLNWLK